MKTKVNTHKNENETTTARVTGLDNTLNSARNILLSNCVVDPKENLTYHWLLDREKVDPSY